MKILVIVLSFKDSGIYEKLEFTARETWNKDEVDNVETIFFYGGHSQNELIGDRLYLASPEGLSNLGHKVISAFEFLLENMRFDFIFKINLSAYLNKSLLKEICSSMEQKNIYSGFLGDFGDTVFTSGAGTLLSKDVVQFIVENKNDWQHNYMEDVSMGMLIKKKNITPIALPRVSIVNGINREQINTKCFHYRCKNENNRDLDILIMKELHNIYGNK